MQVSYIAPVLSSSEVIARARALPATASRAERDGLLSLLLRARAFEALISKNGSEEAARAALAAMAVEAEAARAREIASISCPIPISGPRHDGK